MRILGIDPSSVATGFGVIDRVDGRLHHVAHGVLRPPRAAALPERLAFLQRGLTEVIQSHRPDLGVVERVFVARSPHAALVLGQARGIALAALALAGLPVHELAPRQIKQAVVGQGGAEKRQVQTMVRRLLGLSRTPATDAADALAAAIGQAHAGDGALAQISLRRGRGRGRSTGRFVMRRGG